MLTIRPYGGIAPAVRGSRAAAVSRAAFRLPADAAPETAAAAETVALDGLLGLQERAERDGDSGAGDRAARRHGEDMLRELAGLQRALLGLRGSAEAAPALERLAALAAAVPAAGDPAMRGVLAAVSLRARIELARHARRAAAELSLVAVPQHGYSPPR